MNGILCADMDNTIIYSYKRNIGENKLNVELYNGREISFISEKTHDLLKKVNEKMTIIVAANDPEQQTGNGKSAADSCRGFQTKV